MNISPDNLADMIDHTNLNAGVSEMNIKKLCDEAVLYNFKCVCVNPANVSMAFENLKGSKIGVCSVIGFPLGAVTTGDKVHETKEAVLNGASELDMVMNIGQLKSGRKDMVKQDIQGVVEAAGGRVVKVILETALLSHEEKIDACIIAREAGADFVKTSTGFGDLEGATLGDVELLRKTVGKDMGVKASGGIRDLKKALDMLKAGANRIGTSHSVFIMDEFKSK